MSVFANKKGCGAHPANARGKRAQPGVEKKTSVFSSLWAVRILVGGGKNKEFTKLKREGVLGTGCRPAKGKSSRRPGFKSRLNGKTSTRMQNQGGCSASEEKKQGALLGDRQQEKEGGTTPYARAGKKRDGGPEGRERVVRSQPGAAPRGEKEGRRPGREKEAWPGAYAEKQKKQTAREKQEV